MIDRCLLLDSLDWSLVDTARQYQFVKKESTRYSEVRREKIDRNKKIFHISLWVRSYDMQIQIYYYICICLQFYIYRENGHFIRFFAQSKKQSCFHERGPLKTRGSWLKKSLCMSTNCFRQFGMMDSFSIFWDVVVVVWLMME